MADGGILDGLDKAIGGEGSGAKAKKGKKGKPKPALIAGGVLAAVLVYYLYSKHQSNTAATSATNGTIDPATGVPYADETGSSAIDPATGQTYASELAAANNGSTSSDPLQTVDPNSSSGETYAQELEEATSGATGDASTLATIEAQVAAIPTDPAVAQQAWESGLNAALQSAGVSPDLAAQDVSNYLNGIPLTTAAAVSAVNTYVSAHGPSTTPGGSSLVATLANGVKTAIDPNTPASPTPAFKTPGVVTNPVTGTTDAAAVASLTSANAKLASVKASGTSAQIKAATTNAQNAAKVVESRNAAAKK